MMALTGAVVFGALGLLLWSWGGRRLLLDVITWPALRATRWAATRKPTPRASGTPHKAWRTYARLLRARWNLWRRGW